MKLNIYFKSGNIVTIDNIKEWELGHRSNGSINSFSATQGSKHKTKLIFKSLDLNSIECITETK